MMTKKRQQLIRTIIWLLAGFGMIGFLWAFFSNDERVMKETGSLTTMMFLFLLVWPISRTKKS
jgi:hypothetical protein